MTLYEWATGGPTPYKTLLQCLNGDVRTTLLIVGLCALVGVGYLAIAFRWFRAARSLAPSAAKDAMGSLVWIFLLSALSGYLWPLVKVWFPVWRLQACLLVVLAAHTWRFVLHPRWLGGLAAHLSDRDRLIARCREIEAEVSKLQTYFAGAHAG